MSLPVSRPVGAAAALPPEIAFLAAEGFDPARLAEAAALARACGADAATALMSADLIGEEAYYRALARALGAPFLAGDLRLGEGTRYPESLVAGLAPLARPAGAAFVCAPRGPAIAALLREGTALAVTTPRALREAVFAANPEGIAAYAADTLQRHRPDWALGAGTQRPRLAIVGLLAGAGCLVAWAIPASVLIGAWTLVQLGFLAMVTFRIAAVSVESEPAPSVALSDAELPVYTVLVALHREARMVPHLVAALARLDYPAAKLDIKLVIEADDFETAAALTVAALPARFEVLRVPAGLPRTKPRALNVALPLARGSCLVVYDAEDVPDPGQLRAAAARFAGAAPEVACLQGRLVIDNQEDGRLTRCFALEYAALFDVLIPALASWQLPIPLGGTTTHFRTAVLRRVHGWDAWNVTEDADLGIRLARAGFHVADLPSDTLEEAPRTLRPWLRQRTRWMKGFLQTTLTHARAPRETARQLGVLGTLCAVALVPGTVISALAYPVLMGRAAWDFALFVARGLPAPGGFWASLPTGSAITLFVAGILAMLLPAALGCLRRGWIDSLAFVPLLPLYALLVSLAAWSGLIELIRAPSRWNKTEHGLARTSRSGTLRIG
ncbi:glycosyltransferase family 2 protein [Methylobacterium sp. J-068]|uniref:glycosyltransferase family 2 protein n=1 Tax=Methylobacterium sp. J-068 TaxID=2836649 RepID=UPI001FB87D8E|nr:glycosyltransferase family 2 protein [Methylobacterium sp. J-068]MCJ2036524.1 glycosyltransferase [Methylobacterium sp. J-068]